MVTFRSNFRSLMSIRSIAYGTSMIFFSVRVPVTTISSTWYVESLSSFLAFDSWVDAGLGTKRKTIAMNDERIHRAGMPGPPSRGERLDGLHEVWADRLGRRGTREVLEDRCATKDYRRPS